MTTLDKIATNTEPRDKDLFKVSQERDKQKNYVDYLSVAMVLFSRNLEDAMGEADLAKRAKLIREIIIQMHDLASPFVPSEVDSGHGKVNETWWRGTISKTPS